MPGIIANVQVIRDDNDKILVALAAISAQLTTLNESAARSADAAEHAAIAAERTAVAAEATAATEALILGVLNPPEPPPDPVVGIVPVFDPQTAH